MMQYVTTIEEQEFIHEQVNKLFEGVSDIHFTGTTISPYNLREELRNMGFIEKDYDCNSDDCWITFSHPKIKNDVVMYYNAEAFMLKLCIDTD